DGIRDLIVTGVQTCALPIFELCVAGRTTLLNGLEHRAEDPLQVAADAGPAAARTMRVTIRRFMSFLDDGVGRSVNTGPLHSDRRSEERRVGKECRYQWSRSQ